MALTVEEGAAALARGELVAFPTETVYGLGADAMNADAVAAIFAAKERPADRPLTIHLGPSVDPDRFGVWTDEARALAAAFWPGPLTIIVAKRDVPDVVTAGGDTVGLRMPDHPVCAALLDAFGGGVAAPSANKTGGLSPTTADAVRADLPDVLVLDGGPCTIGLESTVLLLEPGLILRPGAVSASAIADLLGRPVSTKEGRVPHYRPSTPLRVGTDPGPDAAVFGWTPGGRVFERAPDDASAYARRFYAALRELDAAGCAEIVVEPVPNGGIWDVVAQRLADATSSDSAVIT